MDRKTCQQIIIDYQNKQKPKLTQRDIRLNFIPNMALGIVGVRRGGKTFRTHQLVAEIEQDRIGENICRIQFNDHRLARIPATDLHMIDEAYYALFPNKRSEEEVLFIFDEIHRIKGWEDYVLYLLESEFHKVVITGSTASLVKGNFDSQLRGKVFSQELYPFSFREYL